MCINDFHLCYSPAQRYNISSDIRLIIHSFRHLLLNPFIYNRFRMGNGQKIPSIKLATFLRFLAANLGKKLNTQTFRTKKFSFYVAKHKNRHHRGQFNRSFSIATAFEVLRKQFSSVFNWIFKRRIHYSGVKNPVSSEEYCFPGLKIELGCEEYIIPALKMNFRTKNTLF